MRMYKKILEYLIYVYIIFLTILPSKFSLAKIPVNGDGILAAIMAIYILYIILLKDVRKNIIPNIIDCFRSYFSLFYIITFLVMVISILYSRNHSLALGESVRFISYFFIFYILKYELNSKQVFKNIISLYVLLTVILCVIGIIQWKLHLGVENELTSAGNIIRVKSTMENSNNYGAFLILILNPIIILAISEKKKMKRLIYFVVSFLVVINIVMSQSRNAWLSLIVGLVLIIVIYNWKFIFAFITVGGISLFLPQIQNRIKQVGDLSQNASRLKLWKVSFEMIKDYPLFGVGNGNFMVMYDKYQAKYIDLSSFDPQSKFHPHNIILKIQTELGIIGLIPFVALIVTIFVRIREYVKISSNLFFKKYYSGFIVSFVCFMIMNLVDNFFTAPKVIAFFWINISICEALLSNIKQRREVGGFNA
jgi:putative inorganic carbon (hco3(-)) transporter